MSAEWNKLSVMVHLTPWLQWWLNLIQMFQTWLSTALEVNLIFDRALMLITSAQPKRESNFIAQVSWLGTLLILLNAKNNGELAVKPVDL